MRAEAQVHVKVVQKFVWMVQWSGDDWFSGLHKNEGINKSQRFENQGQKKEKKRPISLFTQERLGVKGVEQRQLQELEHRNTTVCAVLSKLFLSAWVVDGAVKSCTGPIEM